MEPKYRPQLGVFGIMGVIFAPIGLLFLGLGVGIPPESVRGSARAFKFAFCGIGALFLALGIVFLALMLRKNGKNKALLSAGYYVMADFVGATPVNTVMINGQYPYQAEFRFCDPSGKIYVFHSRYTVSDPTPYLAGRQVRVYVDPENYDNYYADLDSVLSIR